MTSYCFYFWLLGIPFALCCIATSNSEDAIVGPITTTSTTSPTTTGTTASTTTITTTTTTTPACLSGWIYYPMTMQCYKAFDLGAALITQADAETQCVTFGGHLASIHSAAENSFILSLYPPTATPPATVLGLYRTGPGTTDFAWYDGTPFDYNNWANHPPHVQPDNAGGNQDCVSMFTVINHYGNGDLLANPGEWNDNACTLLQQFYTCELPRL